jgi:hypothetical protein
MTTFKKLLEEKLKEATAMNDFWFDKYQETDNQEHFDEHKRWQGQEQAYYEALTQYEREEVCQ